MDTIIVGGQRGLLVRDTTAIYKAGCKSYAEAVPYERLLGRPEVE